MHGKGKIQNQKAKSEKVEELVSGIRRQDLQRQYGGHMTKILIICHNARRECYRLGGDQRVGTADLYPGLRASLYDEGSLPVVRPISDGDPGAVQYGRETLELETIYLTGCLPASTRFRLTPPEERASWCRRRDLHARAAAPR